MGNGLTGMTRYTNADFNDDDSVTSVQFTEGKFGISTTATHVRYHAGSSLWRQRSKLEKFLLALVGTLLFVILVLAVVVHTLEHRMINAKNFHVEMLDQPPCLTKDCIHIANDILQSMDPSIDPCEDFYAYSCNGWIKDNPLPDGKAQWGTFMKLDQQNQHVIKRILDKPIDQMKSKAEEKAKRYYESCIDANDTMETLGAKPMVDLLKKLGGWSITASGFDLQNWSLQNTIQIVLNKYNIGALFSYTVGEDDKNSSKHVLQIDQGGLTLPTRDYYLNKTEHGKVLDAYLDYMTKVGVLLGGEPNATKQQMAAIIEFETRLANITVPSELRRDEESLYHPYVIADLQEKAPFMDWRKFFEDAMRPVKKKITSKQSVVVFAPEYLGNLTELIREYNSTLEGKKVLNNYMVWQTVRMFTGCLSKAFRDAQKGLGKAISGPAGGEEPQWRYCIQETNNVLGFAIGAIFIREVFQQNPKLPAQAQEMISNVKTSLIKNFKSVNWMDEETRIAAEKKAEAIDDMIGYPEFIKDIHQLDEKYESLTIRSDAYFQNTLNINYFNLVKSLEKIDKPVNRTSWSMAPSAVNAYYTPTKNQMVLPAGILQKPFYDPSYPLSLNYGGIGVVMGHELTHGFDDQGRQFDKDGNLNHWWKNSTVKKFKERAKCYIEQYDKYKVNGKSISGNRTLGENIADNGGLKAAYYAYLEMMKNQTEPPQSYPGLNLNHKQLFFVAFAQIWCSSKTNESVNLQMEQDSHSPAKYRVIGALSNLKEFGEEFKCKPGTRMYPRKRCDLW